MKSLSTPTFPDYGIIGMTLNPFFPMNCPDHSGYETLRLLQETKRLNQALQEQLNEMSTLLKALEEYREEITCL